MKIVWDEPKRLANLDKHGLDFADLTEAFFVDALFVSSRDKRWKGIDPSISGVICVVFARLGREGVSISACLAPAAKKGSYMPKPSSHKRYSAADLAAVSDNPNWTQQDFAKAKRFDEAFPDLAQTIRRRGKQKAPTKKPVSLRLDADVLDAYKAMGEGWQKQMNSDLRKARKLKSGSGS